VNLTPHFKYEEMTYSREGAKYNLENRPDTNQIANLLELCLCLEDIRSLINKPITITSGFRSPKVNALVGGSSKSQHVRGQAADFTCWSYGDPHKIISRIESAGVVFDQLINEFDQWVHLSISASPRQEVLTAKHKNGKVVYEKGLS